MRRITGVNRIDKLRMEERREEAGEELVKVGWTRGKNGRERLMESICAQSGGKKEKRKTETEIGGLGEERFGGSGRGMGE